MAIIIHNDFVQGTQEWLDFRRDKITCSNAYALLTKGKKQCLAINNRHADYTNANGNFYAERGHSLEIEARAMLDDAVSASGLKLVEAGMITNTDYPDAGYSPDGLVVSADHTGELFPSDIKAIIEIKAYNDVVIRNGEPVYVGKHELACKSYDNVPIEAQAQIQMELLISGASVCYLALYNPEAKEGVEKFHIHKIFPDDAIQARLKKKLSRT